MAIAIALILTLLVPSQLNELGSTTLSDFQYMVDLTTLQSTSYKLLLDPAAQITWLPHKSDITTRAVNKYDCTAPNCTISTAPACSALQSKLGINGLGADMVFTTSSHSESISTKIMMATYEDYQYMAPLTSDGVLGLSYGEYHNKNGIIYNYFNSKAISKPEVGLTHTSTEFNMEFNPSYDDKSYIWSEQAASDDYWTLNLTSMTIKSNSIICDMSKIKAIIGGMPYILLPREQYFIVQSYFFNRENQKCHLTKVGYLECTAISSEDLPRIVLSVGAFNTTIDFASYIQKEGANYQVHILMSNDNRVYLGSPFLMSASVLLDFEKPRIGLSTANVDTSSGPKMLWVYLSIGIEVILLLLIIVTCNLLTKSKKLQSSSEANEVLT